MSQASLPPSSSSSSYVGTGPTLCQRTSAAALARAAGQPLGMDRKKEPSLAKLSVSLFGKHGHCLVAGIEKGGLKHAA